MDDQNKNMVLAIVLSLMVLVGWSFLFPPAQPEEPLTPPTTAEVDPNGVAPVPAAGETQVATAPAIALSPEEQREAALSETVRVPILTSHLQGSISLLGGRIDDLHLTEYNVRLNDPSEKFTLLSPASSGDPYYAVYGWGAAGGLDPALLPGALTEWQLESGDTLTADSPITLVWDNGEGLIFRRTISVDEDYMFTITQSVENATEADVSMFPYGIIARKGEPDTLGFYLLHEGVIRFHDGELEEIAYKDMPDQDAVAAEGGNVDRVDVQNSGWIGMTDKYWMTTLIPETGQAFASISKYVPGTDTYQTDMRLPVVNVAAGQTATTTTQLFAGAKELNVIRDYQDNGGVDHFIDSIDWGWFFLITKPIASLLNFLNGIIGNMGWSIIALTLLVKAALFPLAYKSFVSMSKMKKLQPELEKLKERAGDDRQKLQQEMMELYRKEKVNPMSGCLPILLQIPIFFSLYKVLFVTIEMRHAPFYGWIKDLSAPDPTSWLNLFGLLPYDVSWAPAIISIGVFPILMGITMWLQQKLNPAPADKTQAMIFAWLPWVFMFMLGGFAVGLVIYWVANNTITFIQQYSIMRLNGVKPDILGNILKRPAAD